jgi:hypothetical protein
MFSELQRLNECEDLTERPRESLVTNATKFPDQVIVILAFVKSWSLPFGEVNREMKKRMMI